MASASLGSLVIELAASTAKLGGDLGRAATMAENFARRAQRSLNAIGIGVGGFAAFRTAKRLASEFNEVTDYASKRGLPQTTAALADFSKTLEANRQVFDSWADNAAAWWVRLKNGAAEAAAAALSYPDTLPTAPDRFSRANAAILASAEIEKNRVIPFANRPDARSVTSGAFGSTNAAIIAAQENLKTVTEGLRTAEEKRVEGLLDQRKAIESLVGQYPALSEGAQRWIGLIDEQLPSMSDQFVDLTKVTVDMSDAQADFNEQLRQSLIESGLLKENFGSLKEVIEEQAAAQQKRIDAFNKQADIQREKVLAVTNAVGDGIEGAISRGETSFKGFLKGIISGLLGTALRNAIDSLGKQLADAFSIKTGGGGGGLGGFLAGLGSFLGFANGGSFKVGGGGGSDSQLVAFRASPDETVTVTKPGQGGNGIVVAPVFTYNIAPGVTRAELVPILKQTQQATINTMTELIRRGRYA